MATQKSVESLFKSRLKDEAGAQLTKAGKLWKELPMQFYFPQSEAQVDAVVALVVSDCEKADHVTYSDEIKGEVRELINLSTLVKAAIKVVWIASAQPDQEAQ